MPCFVLIWCLMYSDFVKRRTPRMRYTVNDDVVDSSIETTISLCVVVLDLLRATRSSAKINPSFCLCPTSSSSCEARCSTHCAKASSRSSSTCYEGLPSHQTVARTTCNAPSCRQAPLLLVHLCNDIVIAALLTHGGATQQKKTPKAVCAFVCNGKMQNETTTLQSQLMHALFKLLQSGPPLPNHTASYARTRA